jgi:hypothetical protein
MVARALVQPVLALKRSVLVFLAVSVFLAMAGPFVARRILDGRETVEPVRWSQTYAPIPVQAGRYRPVSQDR